MGFKFLACLPNLYCAVVQVLLLMTNLSVNLMSPEFEDHVSLFPIVIILYVPNFSVLYVPCCHCKCCLIILLGKILASFILFYFS